MPNNLTNAARDVMAERQRQIAQEGWSEAHDDEHRHGEMAIAASCYALSSVGAHDADDKWEWDAAWWKPTDRRRDLVKAGALILAEIERLDRIKQTRATGEDL